MQELPPKASTSGTKGPIKLGDGEKFCLAVITFAALCACVESHAAQPGPPKTDGILAIVVADTKKGPAGTLISHGAINATLSSFRDMGIPVEVTSIMDDAVSPSAIIAEVRRLDAAKLKNRTLFFYYAGHGATDVRGGTGHLLRTPRGDLSRAVLVAEIRAKSPALAIIATDSCSLEARLKGPAVPVPIPPEQRVVENLFLQHRGVVDLNGSTYDAGRGFGQAAFYHPGIGGLFTRAFSLMFAPTISMETVPFKTMPGEVWKFDTDGDNFIDWSEAMDFLSSETTRWFEIFRSEVTQGFLRLEAAPADVERLLSQVGQDPQYFGVLAHRSDRAQAKPTGAEPTKEARKIRLGAYLEDRSNWSGGYVVITKVDPRSPASKATEWKYSQRVRGPVPLTVGVIVTRVNDRRVRSRDEFFRILDGLPERGELSISGFRDERGRRFTYTATVALDQFE